MNKQDSSNRYQQMIAWAESVQGQPIEQIALLSGDASFRRYFRLTLDGQTQVLVDADPVHEDNPSFVKIADALKAAGSQVPEVYAADLEHGFMLLSDLGDEILQPKLNDDSVQHYYLAALHELQRIQSTNITVPDYNPTVLMSEMRLFDQWFLAKLLKMEHPEFDLTALYEQLIESALEQPQVFVHRDYHSRNLMLLSDQNLGVLDFQDALRGPITYDLVSLLRDCYVAWPVELVESFALQFKQMACPDIKDQQFMRWFDWMGLQRHLKCVGIFTRLNIRDHKPGYMADIPRVLNYLVSVAQKYPELLEFYQFMTTIKEQYQHYESNVTRSGARQSSAPAD